MKGGVFPSQTGRPRLIVISGNDGMSITIPVLDGYNQDDGSNVGIDIDIIDRKAGHRRSASDIWEFVENLSASRRHFIWPKCCK